MTSLFDLLKKPLVVAVLGVVLGLILGIPLGWATVRVVNTTPAVMRPDLQEDYLRMAIESFQVDRDPNAAVRRWDALGPAAAPLYVEVQKNPGTINPKVIAAYGQLIQAVKASEGQTPETASPGGVSGGTIVLIAILFLVLVGGAVGLFFLRRLLRNPAPTEVTPGMQATEINR